MKKLLVLLLALVLILSSFALAGKAPIVVNMGILDGWTGFPTTNFVTFSRRAKVARSSTT